MTTDIDWQAEIDQARRRLRGHIRQTPVVPSPSLSRQAGSPVFLKLEHHQITGSFKLRGATNAVLSLNPTERARGIVGVSTGNHGRGLAHAARQAGVRAVICMSKLVPQNKLEAIRALGAEVRIVGNSQDEAQAEVDRLIADEGMTMIPPFDHPAVIAGQGTLGADIADEMPDLDTVLVPLSGGGLISGVAVALKAARPSIRVIGVSMERGAAMYESQKAGKPVPVEEVETLADSLGGGVGLDNRYTFGLVRDLVDDIILVTEAQIADAIRHAYWYEQQIIEGSGSVGIAAVKAGLIGDAGRTLLVVSGCNIDMRLHQKLISDPTAASPAETV